MSDSYNILITPCGVGDAHIKDGDPIPEWRTIRIGDEIPGLGRITSINLIPDEYEATLPRYSIYTTGNARIEAYSWDMLYVRATDTERRAYNTEHGLKLLRGGKE